MQEKVRVYIGVGSNIDKHIHIPQVIEELSAEFGNILVSPIYQTSAEGFSGDDFYNLVIGVDTDLTPFEMRHYLRELEASHGRIRDSKNQFISRTLDLDQLMYGTMQINQDGVHVPSSDITNYPFVLKPLVDIAGELVHPTLRMSLNKIWQGFDKSDMQMELVTLSTQDVAGNSTGSH